VFGYWVGVGDDVFVGLYVGDVVVDDGGVDRDGYVEVICEV